MMTGSTKLYKIIASAFLNDIKSGKFGVGDTMPPERDLAIAHGVSRNTIREALIVLEAQGWIEIVHGRGACVLRTSSKSPMDFSDSEVGSFKLLEARRLIEGEICALAAVAITPQEVARLELLLAKMTDPDREIAETADRDFHVAIARATANEALVSVVEILWDWRYWSASAKKLLVDVSDNGMKDRIDEHEAVLRALKAGAAMDARRAMRDHLDRVQDYLISVVETAAIEKVRDANSKRRWLLTERAKGVDA